MSEVLNEKQLLSNVFWTKCHSYLHSWWNKQIQFCYSWIKSTWELPEDMQITIPCIYLGLAVNSVGLGNVPTEVVWTFIEEKSLKTEAWKQCLLQVMEVLQRPLPKETCGGVVCGAEPLLTQGKRAVLEWSSYLCTFLREILPTVGLGAQCKILMKSLRAKALPSGISTWTASM